MVAVNVTDVPAHIDPAGLAAILMVGVTSGVTVIVIEFDVTVTGLGQTAFDPSTHVTASPLFNNAEE